MRVLATALMLGTLLPSACAQTGETLEAALNRLAVDAQDLHDKLPGFACRESLVSRAIEGEKTKRQVTASGEVRVERRDDGTMQEHFSASEQNGKPIKPEKLRVPLFVTGGFENALDHFGPEHRSCYRFTLSADRLDFVSNPDATDVACRGTAGTTGFAILDESGHEVHLEYQVNAQQARVQNATFAAKLDTVSVDFGNRRFLLSKRVTAEMIKGNTTFQWEAEYSGCRLYQATVKVLPADGAPVP